jgi:hypothetical protein
VIQGGRETMDITHCYSKCPALNQMLGFPRRDIDGIPILPAGTLVPLDATTCPTCLGHAAAPHNFGATEGDGLWSHEAE